MSEYVDFHYMPLEGKITGKQVLKQTEDAINDLGNKVYNLDIYQSEIDEAVEKSNEAINTANSALAAVTTGRSVWFNNVAEMVATDIEAGVTAETKGYYVANDGGNALYLIRQEKSGDVVDGGSLIALDNGNMAELVTDGTVNVKQFGAIGNGTDDDTTVFQNTSSYAQAKGFVPFVGVATYKITGNVTGTFNSFGEVTITGGGTVDIINLQEVVSNVSDIRDEVVDETASAKAYSESAATSATNASASASSASTTATQLMAYLEDKEELTAPAVDPTLTISGAAADAKVTGNCIKPLFCYNETIGTYAHLLDSAFGFLNVSGVSNGVTVKTSNKNLFPLTVSNISSSGLTITNNGDGSFTVSGTASTLFSTGLGEFSNLPQGYYVLSGVSAGSFTIAYIRLLKKPTGGEWSVVGNYQTTSQLYVESGYEYMLQLIVPNGSVTNNRFYLQVEKGTSETTFVKHQEDTATSDGGIVVLRCYAENTLLTNSANSTMNVAYPIKTPVYIEKELDNRLNGGLITTDNYSSYGFSSLADLPTQKSYSFVNINRDIYADMPEINFSGTIRTDHYQDTLSGGMIQIAISAVSNKMYYRIAWGGGAGTYGAWQEVLTTASGTGVTKQEFLVKQGLHKMFRKVTVIGDSLASGYVYDANGNPHALYDYAWGAVMASEYNADYTLASFGGARCKTWYESEIPGRGLDLALQYPAQAYLIGLGVNDMGHYDDTSIGTTADINLSDYTQNADSFYGWYAKIIQRLHDLNGGCFFCMLIPQSLHPGFNTNRDRINNAIKSVVTYLTANIADLNVTVLDLYTDYGTYFNSPPITNMYYSSHYQAAAYAVFANIIADAIDTAIYNNPSKYRYLELL